jgi:ssRNA-specific RNase YbeY (16S rRNA maturation enzyme)
VAIDKASLDLINEIKGNIFKKENAKKDKMPAKKEMMKVFIHGILHLLGYEHEKPARNAAHSAAGGSKKEAEENGHVLPGKGAYR